MYTINFYSINYKGITYKNYYCVLLIFRLATRHTANSHSPIKMAPSNSQSNPGLEKGIQSHNILPH